MLLAPSMRHDPWILDLSYASFAFKMFLATFKKWKWSWELLIFVLAIKIQMLL